MAEHSQGGLTRRAFAATGVKAVAALSLAGCLPRAAAPGGAGMAPIVRLGEGERRVLVAHATKSGCTEEIALRVGQVLAARGASVDVAPAALAGPAEAYVAVVVGSGVRAARWHAPARAWLARNAAGLRSRPTALFTCCLTAREPSKAGVVRGYTDPLLAEAGLHPLDVGLFAGWNLPERFSLGERLMLRAKGAPTGDFRDWPAIEAWASALAGPLGLEG